MKSRSKRQFAPQNKAFPHEFTKNPRWGVVPLHWGAGKRKKNFLKNFEFFLSPTSFRPGMLER